MLKFYLRQHAPGWTNLAGATLGERHIAHLFDLIDADGFKDLPGEIVALSFEGFESATASYIKATVLELYFKAGAKPVGSDMSGEPSQHFFPVICDLNAELQHGIHEVFSARRLVCLEATRIDVDRIESATLLGFPDAHLLQTLNALQELEQATASDLKAHVQSSISTTGWNNRLYDLYRLRLVRRTKKDRQWVYELVARCIDTQAALSIA